MQRRQFLGAMSATTFSIAPKWRVVAEESKVCTKVAFRSDFPIVEIRSYQGVNSDDGGLLALFQKHGIAAIEQKPLNFILQFETLAERGAAWNRLASDAAWHELREQNKLQLASLAVYEQLSDRDRNSGTA